MIFGVDLSNHQAHFDFGAAAAEGFDFAFLKCSQNDDFRDGRFQQHFDNARAAGLLVAAYHYQGTAPVHSQIATVKAMVSPDVPVILDVEEGSGGADITRALVDGLRAEGYSVPLSYIPRWYWSGHIGSPDLRGLPPLWVSWYPDYTVRRKEQGLGMVPDSVWSGYGGLDVAVVQFTSAGAVADYPGGNIDLNAFAGTREQLAQLLGGTDMALTQADADLIVDTWQNRTIDLKQGAGPDVHVPRWVAEQFEELRHQITHGKLDQVLAKLAELLARPVADSDEGLGGTDPAVVKAAVAEVLHRTRLTVDQAQG